jgi:hypothetical protein
MMKRTALQVFAHWSGQTKKKKNERELYSTSLTLAVAAKFQVAIH